MFWTLVTKSISSHYLLTYLKNKNEWFHFENLSYIAMAYRTTFFSCVFAAICDEKLHIAYSEERKRKEKNILVRPLIHCPRNQNDQFFAHLAILSMTTDTLNKRLLFIVRNQYREEWKYLAAMHIVDNIYKRGNHFFFSLIRWH